MSAEREGTADVLLRDEARRREKSAAAAGQTLLVLTGVTKDFGPTRAVDHVDVAVHEAEIVGLMGGNGAGKSTLMKIVAGFLPPDEGDLSFGGERLSRDHSPREAMRLGIRFVHQELSLCPNLRVFENFAVELPDLVRGLRWRARAIARARAALDDVFPGNRIDPRARLGALSLSHQQMVEIARSASHPATRLLILDEPTSSLGSKEAEQLRRFMLRRRREGLSFIFISHRLQETLDLVDRIIVMRNGALAWAGPKDAIAPAELLRLLGSGSTEASGGEPARSAARGGDVVVRLEGLPGRARRSVSLEVARGEIVGLAGLEGSGQREVLRAIFDRQDGAGRRIAVDGRTAYVSGDRVSEGVFPLWSIQENIALSSLSRLARAGVLPLERLRALGRTWFERLRIRAPSPEAPITSLSGGNQQKAMIARALATEADIVLLDDPTRGVDLGTKAELYAIFRQLAQGGRTIVWYSTDDAEFRECDRTLVMRDGAIVDEIGREALTAEALTQAAFQDVDAAREEARQHRAERTRSIEHGLPTLIPLVTFALVFAVCVTQSPAILSSFGLTLVFSAAFALSFAAIAQLFVITAGDIDVGLGAFIGLVNAVAATWLVTDPWLAAACFLAMLVAYPLIGVFIHARRVPAIVVTLGLSFVWLGLASYRLPRAGGSAPDWLIDLFRIKIPLLPLPVLLCLAPPLVAYLVLMVFRYGAVLRGFGGNPRAIAAAGWSTHLAQATLYGFAGIFALLAGIVITASTRGGDPTGATSMTLLSVAAVILGGASFAGGVVAPIGALFGTLTLVLVGTLLSLFEVSGVYLPMVQGLMLLAIVGLRTLLVRKEA